MLKLLRSRRVRTNVKSSRSISEKARRRPKFDAIRPTLVILPVIIWAWTAMDTTTALLFTAYMIPVNLIDNVLRPLVMGRGLDTPIIVILIGVIGGTISLGLTGLFLGPIILAVIWELLMAWIRERENA